MGFWSDLFSDDEDSSSSQVYRDTAKYYEGIRQPTAEELTVELQRMVDLGQITPEMATTMYQEVSGMNNITTDPKLYNAQLDSLSSLNDIASNEGLTAMDRAQLNDIRQREASTQQGERGAIENNMAARGLSGSGSELAAKLMSQQASADRSATQGTNVAAEAQQRALAAIQAQGAQAGAMRTQGFNEQESKARAQDAINQYNTGLRQNTENANTASRNAAQAANLERQYATQQYNLGQSNTEAESRANANQSVFNNAATIASGKAGIGTNYANSLQAQNKNTASVVGSIGSSLMSSPTVQKWGSSIGDSIASWWTSDENLKKDKEELTSDQVGDLLDDLTGYSYRYKGDNQPGVGIMAQDLEKTALADNVVDTPKGKMIQEDGLMKSAQWAALANLNERLNALEGK